ncbi:NADH-quinone oxidoreductase subunit G [Yinghuangia seranimata]|uniref:NADH-quinone oxidoreductase subunit G n=1 Tax=Yinghuangia seranimata TaxID=408067 RepID=UPI00248C49A0|nr:NADH-quinone oxidoreductase subunit G [Yinghuangia seranimata]MDI2126998.1 NADH-quinone oxidoreductase subunit G [Yinghuangia seranimata]
MTVTTNAPAGGAPAPKPQDDLVTITVDGIEVSVPKGTLVIRAAELLGITIPRFCDHPLLDPVGACRQCLVDVEGQRKPLASCTTTVTDGMVVRTQLSSPAARKAQDGVMELLLINHPLDCPVCDKGGECPLQNQAMTSTRSTSRFGEVKRTYPKPLPISSEVLLDRERCVLCARCTRFSEQIAGDPFIALIERGALQQVGIYEKQPFESYFSGNTIQICPVGALTSAAYRFRSRPFDLVSSPTACEHCASGCSLRADHRRGRVMRRLAGDDPEVNEEWNCDKGRFAFRYPTLGDRITAPLVRDEESGELRPASWPEAFAAAAEGLNAARGRAGVLVGGRATVEDAYAYAKFARVALGTNDIDFRARDHSTEEAEFLASAVAGTGMGVTYADLERAPAVLLAGFEPEEESPIVFLRLRKAARKGGLKVYTVAPFASSGLTRMNGALLRGEPGSEVRWLTALATGAGLDEVGQTASDLLRTNGAVIMVGERLAAIPGALTAALALADATGARLAWVPRRAGERGALEAGALCNLLPGGRPVSDPEARAEVAAAWRVADLPSGYGLDTASILTAARDGRIGALVVGGVEPGDLPDPAGALAALEAAPFVVSLELRHSEVTERADVVFPVAAAAEKPGTFVDWEGRERPFASVLKHDQVLQDAGTVMPDLRVLHALADEMDISLALPDVASARRELRALGGWAGERAAGPEARERRVSTPGSGEALLATWRLLLDEGRGQDGESALAGTRRAPVVRLSAATAAEIGAVDGGEVTVSTGRGGEVTLPLAVTDMVDRVVWLPTNSPGSELHRMLGAAAGEVVRITAAVLPQQRATDGPATGAALGPNGHGGDGPPNGTGLNGSQARRTGEGEES